MYNDFSMPSELVTVPAIVDPHNVTLEGGLLRISIPSDIGTNSQGSDPFIIIATRIVRVCREYLKDSDFNIENIISMIPEDTYLKLNKHSDSRFLGLLELCMLTPPKAAHVSRILDSQQ